MFLLIKKLIFNPLRVLRVSVSPCELLLVFLLFTCFSNLFAQMQSTIQGFDDGEIAQQYVLWIQNEIDNGRLSEALAALERASDFANVSSDISYLLGYVRSRKGLSRQLVIQALDTSVDTNRWVFYTEQQALMLKAQELIAMRRYNSALAVIEGLRDNADLMMIRLSAYRLLAESDPAALARFRSLVLIAMDRYPRDPRPLDIFLEYAHNRMPDINDDKSDLDLLNLVLRRLPFVMENDNELIWKAARIMQNSNSAEARRMIMAYRSGRVNEPHPLSIPVALNLGIIDDKTAAEELFAAASAPSMKELDLAVIYETYALLRTEEGREFFTEKLRAFTGKIYSDDDHDGFIERYAVYRSGIIQLLAVDLNQENIFDFNIIFNGNELPEKAIVPLLGQDYPVSVSWERYPYVQYAQLLNENYSFRPADYSYAPVNFTVIGGSVNLAGLAYPVMDLQSSVLSKRSLVSAAASLRRPAVEFDNAVEEIFLERGIPNRAVVSSGDKIISITEFVMGFPEIQFLDFDFDGRMETIRRFRRPESQEEFAAFTEAFDCRFLLASSESDWTGDGRYKTGEMYLHDGSFVYLWDMEGSGIFNYSETEAGSSKAVQDQ